MTTALLILSVAANILLATYALSYRSAYLENIHDLAHSYDTLDHALHEIDRAHNMITPAPDQKMGTITRGEEPGMNEDAWGETMPPMPLTDIYNQLRNP